MALRSVGGFGDREDKVDRADGVAFEFRVLTVNDDLDEGRVCSVGVFIRGSGVGGNDVD